RRRRRPFRDAVWSGGGTASNAGERRAGRSTVAHCGGFGLVGCLAGALGLAGAAFAFALPLVLAGRRAASRPTHLALELLEGGAGSFLGLLRFAAHLQQKTAGDLGPRLAPFRARLAQAERQLLACARHADVAEAPLFLDLCAREALGDAALVRQEALFHAHH